MPQLFQALKCYNCLVFQVHQVKKSNKWECKLCGEKQSIKRHYGLGTGKECRLHVQKLNDLRGEIYELALNNVESSEELENNNGILKLNSPDTSQSKQQCRWSEYVENESIVEENNEAMYLDKVEVVLEKPRKYKKLGNWPNKNKKSALVSVLTNPRYNEEEILENSHICDSDIINSSKHTKSIGKIEVKMPKFVAPIKSESVHSTLYDEYPDNLNKKMKMTSPKENSRMSMPDNKSIKYINSERIALPQSVSESKIATDRHLQCQLGEYKPMDKTDKSTTVESIKYPFKFNKNSKWAQFTDWSDNAYDIGTESSSKSSSIESSQHIPNTGLFSLCDDKDLDNVLDF